MLGQLHYFRILKFIPKSVRTNHNHVVIVYLETCDFRLVDNDSVLGLFGFHIESTWLDVSSMVNASTSILDIKERKPLVINVYKTSELRCVSLEIHEIDTSRITYGVRTF